VNVKVLNAYTKSPWETLLEACKDPKYLERLTGLDKLFEEGEKALEDVEWMEGEEGEDGDDF
jgi:ubiquitin-like modifier-activating enzyme ATG7